MVLWACMRVANCSLRKHAHAATLAFFIWKRTVGDFGSSNRSLSCPASPCQPFKLGMPLTRNVSKQSNAMNPSTKTCTPSVKLETKKHDNSESHEIGVLHTRQTAEKERLRKSDTVCLMLHHVHTCTMLLLSQVHAHYLCRSLSQG